MTKQEFEKWAEEVLMEVRSKYHEVYPEGKYLDLALVEDALTIVNEYWENDEDFPIHIFKVLKEE